ncbi:MAG TPA: GNAT family N-acetyltransferase [Candidatus Saccharimonadales bacterium]|nr:GNAT family N-acetyltransferase [Candidatus Saccharimonadales bacterium]
MIEIQELVTVSSEIEDFQRKEWEFADQEYFGRIIAWKKEKKILQVIENAGIVGILELTMQAGVMHIDSLIVHHAKHGQGIGKALMVKAEEIAKGNKMHKIYLDTGKNWPATKFYETLGYIKTGDLPKHSEKQDYIEYSKFL